ncbi:hypothetical protein [Amycolatopsis thermoflava]|uniref:hypothetical protein n=1 Tax=Amycolatopsis thermoflava TaxID=84480 RepID=UPI003EBD58E8
MADLGPLQRLSAWRTQYWTPRGGTKTVPAMWTHPAEGEEVARCLARTPVPAPDMNEQHDRGGIMTVVSAVVPARAAVIPATDEISNNKGKSHGT